MYDVLALGELLIDFACDRINENGYPTMTAHPGGAPANFLATLTKFGAKTAMIGKVGNDAFGGLLLDTLRDAGVETRGMIVSDKVFTTLAFVTIDKEGDRHFSFARKPGADTQLCLEEINKELIDATRVFHFGTLSLTCEPIKTATQAAVAYAKERGKLITYDPNLRKPLWENLKEAKEQMLWGLHQADVVKLSDEECDFLFGPIPSELAARKILDEYDCKLVFVTLGKNGCTVANKNACGSVQGMTGLNVVDTTGAGDIFGGSAVWKLLQSGKTPAELEEGELREIAHFACVSAGLSTETAGGIPSIPSLKMVNDYVAQD